jgi:hypothetical protein
MGLWPTIDEPLLLDRLAMDDEAFVAFATSLTVHLGRRELTPELYERAIAYPWVRPLRSYVLTDGEVRPLHDVAAGDRAELVRDFTTATGPGPRRHALLAFGSNGAPSTLTAKFAHLGEDDRRVLVVAGDLHDFDVGSAAQPTAYGAMPATLFASPGTAVRAAVLWVTDAQFTLLTWTEISYRLGLLRGVRFTPDDGFPQVDDVLAFVSRFGVFCPNDGPVALAAIPAAGRTAPELTQEQLLTAAARHALGPEATARTLVEAIFNDMAALGERVGDAIRRRSQPFASTHWEPYPGA